MFKLLVRSKKSSARLAVIKTKNGQFITPAFMPIATRGSVKTLSAEDLRKLGSEVILSNTYHLFQRPGLAIIKKQAGLHKLMDWQGPILTDSGGYQVFSLAKLRQITKAGVTFVSPYDGAKHFFSPEKVLQAQQVIDSDINMVLDVCSHTAADKKQLQADMKITHAWAKKSLNWQQKHKNKNLLFCIVQGGTDIDLRQKAVTELINMQTDTAQWDGFAIGGLAVGESQEKTLATVRAMTALLPKIKPRYLMGVGYPEQIVEAVLSGVDMFDCVIPSREARHGRLYRFCSTGGKKLFSNLRYETININSAKWRADKTIINNKHSFIELRRLSLGYLCHLFKVGEPLALRLASLQNIWFYLELMKKLRQAIKQGKL